MSSVTLQSTTFVPSQEASRANNNSHLQMCPDDLSTWVDQDVFSTFSNNFGDINDLSFQNCFSLDRSLNYFSMTGVPSFELISHVNEPLLAQCNGYNGYSLCNFDQIEENSFGGSNYQMSDKGDVDNVYSAYPNCYSSNIYDDIGQPETWGHQRSRIPSCGSEISSTNKVGRYSVEERRDKILRYLKKKNQRNFRKTIKYACRKTLADRRVRVRGRFAKNEEEEIHSNQDDNMTLAYLNYTKNEEYSDQDWLQEAMEALMP